MASALDDASFAALRESISAAEDDASSFAALRCAIILRLSSRSASFCVVSFSTDSPFSTLADAFAAAASAASFALTRAFLSSARRRLLRSRSLSFSSATLSRDFSAADVDDFDDFVGVACAFSS